MSDDATNIRWRTNSSANSGATRDVSLINSAAIRQETSQVWRPNVNSESVLRWFVVIYIDRLFTGQGILPTSFIFWTQVASTGMLTMLTDVSDAVYLSQYLNAILLMHIENSNENIVWWRKTVNYRSIVVPHHIVPIIITVSSCGRLLASTRHLEHANQMHSICVFCFGFARGIQVLLLTYLLITYLLK